MAPGSGGQAAHTAVTTLLIECGETHQDYSEATMAVPVQRGHCEVRLSSSMSLRHPGLVKIASIRDLQEKQFPLN